MMWSLKPFNGAEMRSYLDILQEAPSPLPTAQQAADLDAGTQQVAQGADKFSQGNYASGAMDVAKGMNATANAAGMSLGDKLNAVGMAIKAAGSAGLAALRGRNPAYAAMGSLAKNATGPAADYVSSPQFAQQFKAGIDAARNNPNADPSLKQMVADYDAGKLTADSFKAYVQRVASQANAAASGQEVDIDGNDDYTVKEQGQAAQPLDIDGTEYRQGGVKQLGIQPSQQDIHGREQAAGTLQTIDTLRKDAGRHTHSYIDPKVHSITGGMKQDMQNLDKKLAVAGVGRQAPSTQPQTPNTNRFKDLEDLEESEELPGTKGEWRHGGHSVRYHPDTKTVHVKGKGGEEKHTFSKHPKHDMYRSRVQQIIDKLENSLTEAEKIRELMNRLS